MAKPTFEEIRRWSRNGKTPVREIIKGRSFEMRASVSRVSAWMDFDMHCGNHDIRREISQKLAERYWTYCESERFRPRKYVTFTHKVFSLQVRRDDAEEWFSSTYDLLSDLANLARIRMECFEGRPYRLPDGLLRTVERVPEGEVVEVNADAFTEFAEDLTWDYEIVLRMTPRDFERAIAAAYSRSGRFDRVILTPPVADEGRDVILESSKWAGRRFLVELKRYRRRRVSAELVNSLLGVLTAELNGSRAALMTTSSFAPRLKQHRSIRKAVASKRLELLELVRLVEGCIQCEYSNDPEHFGSVMLRQ